MTQSTPLIVLYNDACGLCRAEISHYRSYADSLDLPIAFVDLNTADLTPWRLTRDEAARRLYVSEAGTLHAGIDGFLRLWAGMPRYRWLARVAGLPGIKSLAQFVYERVLAPTLYARHKRRMAAAGTPLE